MQQALIGADPECFLSQMIRDPRNGPRWDMIPAFGLFGGDKEAPIKMENMDEGYAYLEDNAALEFNIPPQGNADGFVSAIENAKHWLKLNAMQPKSLEFSEANVFELPSKYQRDPRGQRVGCQPDFDAYANEGAQREPFSGDSLGPLRYAGGHIHLAYNVDAIPPYVAARFMDIYLSLPWLEYDVQHLRRGTYGKAGLFRPKSYGVEYRTPSNWWLWQSANTVKMFAEGALYFARKSYEPEYLRLLSEAYVYFPWDDAKNAIETEDYRIGHQLVDLANQRFQLKVQGDRARVR